MGWVPGLLFLSVVSRKVDSFAVLSSKHTTPLYRGTHGTVSSLERSGRDGTKASSCLSMSSSAAPAAAGTISAWEELREASGQTIVGAALDQETHLRQMGGGSAAVGNKLRLYGKQTEKPTLTLFRDHAGWCPYCQKAMLLVEEKEIPMNIELVPMRSYGDKPKSFTDLVPSGLLPALMVERSDGKKQVITESQVIMELLDTWHPASEGYKPMMPSKDDTQGRAKYTQLAQLERELFSWWCTLIFRPEGRPRGNIPGGGAGGLLAGLLGGNKSQPQEEMSGAMRGFLDCMGQVEKNLGATPGPWFFSSKEYDHPTMIDFVYVSHVERMLASCAYWKGLELRSRFPNLDRWLTAFEQRECYLAFKSDYYTHVMDIPPQYGPGCDGGFDKERMEFQGYISGRDGKSWTLPLPHDDPIQPLYRGPPVPLCVLQAAGIVADPDDGSYVKSDPDIMARACRQMAGWKLSLGANKVSKFAARGGRNGGRNMRKTFGAELADPYADADMEAQPHVDAALRIVCSVLLREPNEISPDWDQALLSAVPKDQRKSVMSSLCYLRDRVGVPRDLPLAAGRQLRAHLNWAIDIL